MEISIDALLERITLHAVARYCERVLGTDPLEPNSFASALEHAAASAQLAGLSIAEVRRLVLVPPVAAGMLSGAARVRTAAFVAEIQNGKVVTVHIDARDFPIEPPPARRDHKRRIFKGGKARILRTKHRRAEVAD